MKEGQQMLVHSDRVNSESVKRLIKEQNCQKTLILDNKNILDFKNTQNLFTIPNISDGSGENELEFILRYLEMLDKSDFRYTDIIIIANKITRYDSHKINERYKSVKARVKLHLLFEGSKNITELE